MSDPKTMMVDISLYCSRRGKEVPVKVPLAEAQAAADLHAQKAQISEDFAERVLSEPVLPDAVFLYKGQCVVLANVNERSDEAVRRALNLALGAEVFPVPPPVPRKKRDSDEDPQVEIEDEMAKAPSKQPRRAAAE